MARIEVRVLILGAGIAGQQAADAMRAHPQTGYHPLGFIDDDSSKLGTRLADLEVLGASHDIPRLVEELAVDEILIAMPSETGITIRRLVRACEDVGVAFKIVPGIREIILGDVHIEQIRHVEPEDLLGRDSVAFEPELGVDYIAGRSVLVTGAGGSIGAELCRQVVVAGASRLMLLGRGENSIFDIESELRAGHPGLDLEPIIADVRDRRHLELLLEARRPDVIFHAAAHKHVYYMERFPAEAVLRNVIGTFNLLRAAIASGAECFVQISTDKAAEPQSIMGATKRLAEELVCRPGWPIRTVAVRFGNVLGSRGSVVPLFKRQIARGGPVTVSHPEVTRYFMTVREAASLVVGAGEIGEGGEVFILDMGQPIRIVELARELITFSGYRPDQDIPIVFTGLKAGEKLHERLWSEGETVVPTRNPRILSLTERRLGQVPEGDELEAWVDELEEIAESRDSSRLLEVLSVALPSYRPTEPGDAASPPAQES